MHYVMTRRVQYIVGVLVLTLVLSISTFVIMREGLDAADGPIDRPVAAYWLRIVATVILFPINYTQYWKHDTIPLSEFYIGLLFNSFLWALVIVFLFRLGVRFLSAKNEKAQRDGNHAA